MRAKKHDMPPAAGHYRLARGTHLHADYVLCEYPLRILRPGAGVLRLLASCIEERTPGELAALLALPLKRVEQLCEQLRWKGLLEAGPPLPPGTWPSVSVIIPSYNRSEQLERCLRSLLMVSYPAGCLEIIVVDDCSTDSTGAIVEQLTPEFTAQGITPRYARNNHRQGAAQSRNRGAQAARFDLLAYLDSDCIATKDWLAALVPAFSDPTVAAAGGMLRAWERRSLLGSYEDKKSSLYMGSQEQQVTLAGPLTYLSTANLLVRREALNNIGGFAPMPFGEDVDLCRRLLLDGARILYLPQGIVLHNYRTTLPAFLRTRASYASAEAALLRRHPSTRRILLLPPEQAAFASLAIGGVWGLVWMLVKWLGSAFPGISRTGKCPDPTSSGATRDCPGLPPDTRKGHPQARTGYPQGASLHVRLGLTGYPQGASLHVRARFTALASLVAILITLVGTLKRLRSVREQHVMLHPFVILRATLRSHLAYTYHLCRHLTRYYTLPMLITGVIVPPLLLLVLILCGIVIGVDYARLRPDMRLGQFAVCSLLDDCAYEVGVVMGCIKQRTWKPLVPVFRKEAAIISQQHTFRVPDLQAAVDEPLGGGAAAVTGVVLAAAAAGAAAHVAIEGEEGRAAPDVLETVLVQVARLEFGGLEEGAGVDLAFGTDAAGGGGSAAHVEARQLVAEGVEVEERVGGQHVGMLSKPVGEGAVLLARGVQFSPYILPAARGAQARHAQFGVEAGGNLVEAVQFGEAVARQDAVDGQAQVFGGQAFQAAHGALEDALAPDTVVGGGSATVKADLEIDRIERGQAAGAFLRDERAICADAHHQAALLAAFQHLPDAGIDKRLPSAKVDLKDLHLGQLVHQRQRLLRRQLARATFPRCREAMHAGDVAGGGDLPRDGNRRGQPTLQETLRAARTMLGRLTRLLHRSRALMGE